MPLYCRSCRTTSGRHRAHDTTFNEEFLEMDRMGSRRVKGELYSMFQCPRCDEIRAKISHSNGMSTTRTMSPDEVQELPSGSGLLGALVTLGIVVAGVALIAEGSDDS
jgi:hypothetical protein